MYGKYFASTFTGSMFGAGAGIFAVWGYAIAHAVDGQVELNAPHVAAILGMPVADVEASIAYLAAPDARSRTPTAEGRRLVHLQAFAYEVVNHALYRSMRNEDDRREYNRDAKRRERAKIPTKTGKPRVQPVGDVIRRVNDVSALSAHTEAEAERSLGAREAPPLSSTSSTDVRFQPVQGSVHPQEPDLSSQDLATEGKPKPPTPVEDRFARFWSAYPKREGKQAAFRVWVRLKVTEAMTDTIIAAVEAQKSWPKWTKQNGAFIPNPATWLNAGGWDDEPPPVVRAGVSEKTAGNIDAAKRFIERMKGKKPEGES